ncbi:MAG: ASKHA domain-containing protein [Clostridiales Family XIII bacterium]|nr:ASKHA domain-containing protein [Clostridiales Family XIII bacterium]
MDNLGISFDVGTTTLTGILWDLDRNNLIGRLAMGNPQSRFGADIIFRLASAMKGEAERKKLQASVVGGMNDIIDIFEDRYAIRRGDIRKITAVGNTVMQHLLLGEDPSALTVPPYMPTATGAVLTEASSIGLEAAPGAELYAPPCIGSYVGSDITAGLLAVGIDELPGCTLFVDIGTNGEIALMVKGRLLVCSAAAGPAFEGASLNMGMRAGDGAVEKVDISRSGVSCLTVGRTSPRGLCGSGAISAAAALLEAGLMDNTGRMSTADELKESGTDEVIYSRMIEGEQCREFIISSREDGGRVVITQKDVREIQLAKAAISAGIKVLLSRAAIAPHEVSRLLLAGTFGNNIDIRSACRIGLFSGVGEEFIVSMGNAAGDGASLILTDDRKKTDAERIAKMSEHVSVANEDDFQELLLNEMDFS